MKYIKFALAHTELNEDDLEIIWMRRKNLIHPDYLIDSQLANFLTHEFDYHKEKRNQLESNLRATKSWVVTSLRRAGKTQVSYPEFVSCWDGIKRHPDYIKSKNHERAPSATLQDHIRIKQVSVFDKNNMYDKDIVANRDGYGISYGTGLRGDNMHKLKEKDVTVEREPTSQRPYLLIKTASTKTCKKREEWIVVCECPYNQPHDSFNTECPVAIHSIHSRLKYNDFIDYCKTKMWYIVNYHILEDYFGKVVTILKVTIFPHNKEEKHQLENV